MKNNPLTNLKLDIKSVRKESGTTKPLHLNCSGGTPGAKLYDDLNLIMSNNHSYLQFAVIKKLELDGEMFSTRDFNIRVRILQALGHKLEELTLSGYCKPDMTDFHFPQTIALNRLKKFEIVKQRIIHGLTDKANCLYIFYIFLNKCFTYLLNKIVKSKTPQTMWRRL